MGLPWSIILVAVLAGTLIPFTIVMLFLTTMVISVICLKLVHLGFRIYYWMTNR